MPAGNRFSVRRKLVISARESAADMLPRVRLTVSHKKCVHEQRDVVECVAHPRCRARHQAGRNSNREGKMSTLSKKVTAKATEAARDTAARVKRKVADVETRLLVDEGRRSIRAKTATVKKVTKRALKAGLVTGVATVAAVLVSEVRKRRAR